MMKFANVAILLSALTGAAAQSLSDLRDLSAVGCGDQEGLFKVEVGEGKIEKKNCDYVKEEGGGPCFNDDGQTLSPIAFNCKETCGLCSKLYVEVVNEREPPLDVGDFTFIDGLDEGGIEEVLQPPSSVGDFTHIDGLDEEGMEENLQPPLSVGDFTHIDEEFLEETGDKTTMNEDEDEDCADSKGKFTIQRKKINQNKDNNTKKFVTKRCADILDNLDLCKIKKVATKCKDTCGKCPGYNEDPVQCTDSKGKFTVKRTKYTCKDVTNGDSLCNLKKVSNKCKASCGTCSATDGESVKCEDSLKKFNYKGSKLTCNDITNGDSLCNVKRIQRLCRSTCGECGVGGGSEDVVDACRNKAGKFRLEGYKGRWNCKRIGSSDNTTQFCEVTKVKNRCKKTCGFCS